MLQKLPKTVGDSIMLGTPIAIGICPNKDKKGYIGFVSFECRGELITYEIPERYAFETFGYQILEMAKEIEESVEIPKQDLRCVVIDTGYRILNSDGETIMKISR